MIGSVVHVVLHNPVISYLGPVIAIAAISSSFFGHYLGAAEGAAAIVRDVLGRSAGFSTRT